MKNENWKHIEGYGGRYLVSCQGRVKSLDLKICIEMRGKLCCRLQKGRVLRQSAHYKGYQTVYLRVGDGSRQKFFVHRLVAVAFIEEDNHKEFVNHKDKDRTNNCTENLEWMTHEENMNHRDNYVPDDQPF